MTMMSVISSPPGISIHSGRCRWDSGLTFLGAGRCPAVPGAAAGAATPCPASGALALLMAVYVLLRPVDGRLGRLLSGREPGRQVSVGHRALRQVRDRLDDDVGQRQLGVTPRARERG